MDLRISASMPFGGKTGLVIIRDTQRAFENTAIFTELNKLTDLKIVPEKRAKIMHIREELPVDGKSLIVLLGVGTKARYLINNIMAAAYAHTESVQEFVGKLQKLVISKYGIKSFSVTNIMPYLEGKSLEDILVEVKNIYFK